MKEPSKLNIFQRIIQFSNRNIDYKMGVVGAFFMAGIVFYINYHGTHDSEGSTTAALKQGTFTFFFGGIMMRMSERFASEIKKRRTALIAACIIPSLVSLSLTYGMHSLKGTPRPIKSTIPTAVFVFPTTAIWGFMKRKKIDKENEKKNN